MQEPDDSLLQEGSGEARQWCFGCGERNPEGLHIEFQVDGRSVTGRFTARQSHQGYPGVAHGGIAASVLDEAMGWAMYAAGVWAMTARMQVRYRRPLPLAREVAVTAEVVRERGRWLEARAELRTLDGSLLAEAEGLFVRVPRERARRLQAFFTGRAAEPARG